MNTAPEQEQDAEGGSLVASESVVALLNKGEVDMQVATAHKYPRNVTRFRADVASLATLNEDIAAECSYALRRADAGGGEKLIVGPSARFAEIIASAWGNCRAGARIVDDRGDSIVAQGAFMDLQRNVAITYEVQRRIVNKKGARFSPDMVSVTANAACSIALRNAILKGVPKAFWNDLWEQARRVAVGDEKTLSTRRDVAFKKIGLHGITPDRILAKLGRASIVDVTVEDLEVLLAAFTSLKESEASPEELFPIVAPVAAADGQAAAQPGSGVAGMKERMRSKREQEPAGQPVDNAGEQPAQ